MTTKAMIQVAILVAIAAGSWLAFSPRSNPIGGRLELHKILSEEDSVELIRGTIGRADYRLVNRTRRRLRVEHVLTGCGCAVIGTDYGDVVGKSLIPGGELQLSLTVDTAAKTGKTIIPIEVAAIDESGKQYRAHAEFQAVVNPGCIASRARLSLNGASNQGGDVISDELILFQTSAVHSLRVEKTTIHNSAITVAVTELPSDYQTERVFVVGGDPNWPTTPRYSVTVTANRHHLKVRRQDEVRVEFANHSSAVTIPVEIIPPRQSITVVPAIVWFPKSGSTAAARELVITTDGSATALQFDVPHGVTLTSQTTLSNNIVKLVLGIAPEKLTGNDFLIRDCSGNLAKVQFVPEP